MTDTQNIHPISTRTMGTSQAQNMIMIMMMYKFKPVVTIQVETPTTTVDSHQPQILELVTTSSNSVQLPLIDNQLQSTV